MTAAPTLSGRWSWALAVLLMVVEFLVFDRMTARHHARLYPRWTDQTYYLADAYKVARDTQTQGLAPAVVASFHAYSPQGVLHNPAAGVIFWLVGSPSRSAALSLNILLFLAWQATLLAVIPRVTGSRALGWVAFGLVLCIAWPWTVDAGSAYDFRLDHAALCLMGVTAALALLTEGFRSTRWSLVFGLAAAVTLLDRFLTGVYFAGIFLAFGAWILCGPERLRRLRNLFFAGLIMLVLAGPAIWAQWTYIYGYYWAGHFASATADIRASPFDAWQSVAYVVGNLARVHLGSCFLWVAGIITTGLGVAALLSPPVGPGPSRRDWLFTGLVFFAVPAAVLAQHREKSMYVLGVIIPGVVLLLLWLWQGAWRRMEMSQRVAAVVKPLTVVLALAAGLGFFLQRQVAEPHSAAFAADAAKINRVADYLYTTSQRAGLAAPGISTDLQIDYLNAQTLNVLCYERHKQWMSFAALLPVGITEEPDAFIMERIAKSDFVFLTDVFPENGFYPYDRQMRRLYPVVKQWCEQNLRRVDTFPIFNRRMSLYQRRELPVSPIDGDRP